MSKVTTANIRTGNINFQDAIVASFDKDNANIHVASDGSTLTVDLTATSPAAASTVAGTAVTGLGGYRSMMIYADLVGATGGTLDVYLQVSPDSGTTWVDYAHFTQLAAGGAEVFRLAAVTKDAAQLTPTAVGTGTSPALAANTIVGGDWGDQIRVLFVAGVSTSLGASQKIKLFLSN